MLLADLLSPAVSYSEAHTTRPERDVFRQHECSVRHMVECLCLIEHNCTGWVWMPDCCPSHRVFVPMAHFLRMSPVAGMEHLCQGNTSCTHVHVDRCSLQFSSAGLACAADIIFEHSTSNFRKSALSKNLSRPRGRGGDCSSDWRSRSRKQFRGKPLELTRCHVSFANRDFPVRRLAIPTA